MRSVTPSSSALFRALLVFGLGFVLACGDDDGSGDAGAPPEDGGAMDAGASEDAGTRDSGTGGDAGARVDAGMADAGSDDAGTADAGTADAGDALMGCDPEASPFGGGAGTEEDPYLLCAPAHWLALGPDEDVHHRLVADLDFAGRSYAPIADFGGVLEGGGHALANVTIAGVDRGALFLEVFGATLRDLRVEGLSVTATHGAAGLVLTVVSTRPTGGGFSRGAASTFEDVRVEGAVEATGEAGVAAGILGTFGRGSAADLRFEGSVEGVSAAGAIDALARDASARRVFVDAEVVAEVEASGLVRFGRGTLEEGVAHGAATGGARVSGLFGELSQGSATADVYSDMDLTLTHGAALELGGIGSDIYRVGGVVATPRFGRGRAGSLTDFYFGGTITVVDAPPSGFASVAGGLFGCWGGYTGCNGEWIQGGCYWDTETSGRSTQGGGQVMCTGLSSAELATPAETPELEPPTWVKTSGAAPTLAFEAP